MAKHKIVMIDDDPKFLEHYRAILQDRYEVFTALDILSGLKLIEERQPRFLLLDVAMQREREGLEALPQLRRQFPALLVVVVTNYDSHLIYKEALASGAHDYFIKSEKLQTLRLILENLLAEAGEGEGGERFSFAGTEAVVRSPRMQQIFALSRKIAASECSVLINGETGVGKEVVARYLHAHSRRKDHPFVAVNCAAIPENLFENELFGHERGAYTDARETRIGKLEKARGGVLFLDEVAEISPAKQAVLLRVLEEHTIERLGGTRTIPLDIRVISATNADLKERMEKKLFREDLFYRLTEEEIAVPPLREREADILPLCYHFLRQAQERENCGKKIFTQQALLVLKNYYWPGNVRQLRNIVNRGVVHSYGRAEIRPTDLSLPLDRTAPPVQPYEAAKEEALRRFQREYLKPAIVRHDGNLSAVAAEAGISRQGLQKMLKELNLDVDQ